MKALTITVPCYNSEKYMDKCIDSLLYGGEDVEILIVDDGSTDRTAEIADDYQRRYPHIIRAIHQKNKGHGGAVNTGIREASGLYFKVVDSDDWVDRTAYEKILDTLHTIAGGSRQIDALFSNYVYEKQGAKKKRVMKYQRHMPEGRIFGWDEMKHMGPAHYVLMHSIIYRTEILRESGLSLPEHTFYVDNLYAYIPFVKVRQMYYLNVNFYRYFIGRSDQSVNETVMIGRLDQQEKVNRMMMEFWAEHKNDKMSRRQKEFLVHDLQIITTITTVLLLRSKLEDADQRIKALWGDLKKADFFVYTKIRWSLMGAAMHLPGKPGKKIVLWAYKLANKYFGFN